MGRTDQKSIAECFQLANEQIYDRSHGYLSNRAYDYNSQNNRIHRLEQFLRVEFSLAKFEYVGCGDNAIIVRYSDTQALRFRAPPIDGEINTQSVVKAPFMCPIFKEIEFDGCRLNFVPYIPALSLAIAAGKQTPEIGKAYIYRLLEEGFNSSPPLWFHDYKNSSYKYEQIGLLDDHTPIIIDQGSVIPEALADDRMQDRLLEDKKRKPRNDNIPNWDGKWRDRTGAMKIESLPKPPAKIIEYNAM